MIPLHLSLAIAFCASLAFVAYCLHLRRIDTARATREGMEAIRKHLEARTASAEKLVEQHYEIMEDQHAIIEEGRLALSKRVSDLEFRVLGKRLSPPKDEHPGG